MSARPTQFVPQDISETLRDAGCVFADDEARLLVDAAIDAADLHTMVAQRVSGVPLEHILGWAQFCGRRMAVTAGVFIPRRRSEFLVQLARALLHEGDRVVDLCTGSGAIAAVLQREVKVEVHACDIDPDAVACARLNLGSTGAVYAGDLFAPLPVGLKGCVDLVVANVPYVPTDAMSVLPYEARVHERDVAFDGGPDGLDVLRRVAGAAPDWLAPGGHLLVEASERQCDQAEAIVERAGLQPRVATSKSMAAHVVIGSKRA